MEKTVLYKEMCMHESTVSNVAIGFMHNWKYSSDGIWKIMDQINKCVENVKDYIQNGKCICYSIPLVE